MLYSILFAVLVAYVLCTPVLVVKSIQFGMSLSRSVEKNEEKPIFFNIPKKKSKPKMTPEQETTMAILANIDMYDGTSNGQREIKHGDK